MMDIFTDKQRYKAEQILQSPLAKLSDLTLSEIRNLAVVWCYYSEKIEGNTYTYVETEALLKDGITSRKQYKDAEMLKNLHDTFLSEIRYVHEGGNTESIDEFTLSRLHSRLSAGLIFIKGYRHPKLPQRTVCFL